MSDGRRPARCVEGADASDSSRGFEGRSTRSGESYRQSVRSAGVRIIKAEGSPEVRSCSVFQLSRPQLSKLASQRLGVRQECARVREVCLTELLDVRCGGGQRENSAQAPSSSHRGF